jgi:CRP/FNR family cyclic AMP-dependent transcriptional regulator
MIKWEGMEVDFLKTKIEILKTIPMFNELSPDDLEKISTIVIERNYRKNMILFIEGEPGEAFYFIFSGKVKISKTSEDGREHILDIAGPGDTFAEVVLFTDAQYPATAEVIEDARIGMIRNRDMEKLVQENASLALSLIKTLSQRLIQAQLQVKQLAFSDTYSRTATILLKLAKEHGRKTEKGIELKLHISRQELGSMVGTTRETVTRVLTTFKKSGILEIDRQNILIRNTEKLKSWT